jgi:AcrR family transcriptional regulator
MEDKRVRRSRRLLGDALLDLLKTRSLRNIKIRDVTDHADVGYMTFYRHYDSLDDLLVDRIRVLVEQQIIGVIAACDKQGPVIFNHINEYAALYRSLLFSPEAAQAQHKLERMLADFFVLTVVDHPIIPPLLRANQMAVSTLCLARWWLETNQQASLDEVAAIYEQMVIAGNVDQAKLLSLTAKAANLHQHYPASA